MKNINNDVKQNCISLIWLLVRGAVLILIHEIIDLILGTKNGL